MNITLRMLVCVLLVGSLVQAGCGDTELGKARPGGGLRVGPLFPVVHTCSDLERAEIWAGDYFYRGGSPEYPLWVHGVRVFWRPDVEVVPFVCSLTRCWPVRWVIAHSYGGCDYRDELCMGGVLGHLRSRGVTYVEIANEADVACRSCLWIHEKVAREAKAMGLTVVWNVEPYVESDRMAVWGLYDRLLRSGLADRVVVHALEPHDLGVIPEWLWRSGRLEISTDGQHCQTEPYGCQHIDTTELLVGVWERFGPIVSFEADLWDDGSVEPDAWAQQEFEEFRLFVEQCIRPPEG